MLPPLFLSRMQSLLGTDFPAFLAAMEEDSAKAVRINTVKIETDAFLSSFSLPLTPIPYSKDGFYFSGDKIGHTPAHHAGLLYAQDPGAMSSLCAVDVEAGWHVLDMCAAPGGKSAQLAAAVGESGMLVSCEYVPSRCKLLVGNVERLGIRNALVLHTDSASLASLYPACFDLTLVDAPCSGEGMFRKNGEAVTEWSEENVRLCAARQKEILDNGAKTVREGGYLLYSTCTFSQEENEGQIAAFLDRHPDFSLVPVKETLLPYTASGIPQKGREETVLCRRFYPHIAKGEGQFIALLRRAGNEKRHTPAYADASLPLSKKESDIVNDFFIKNMAPDALIGKRVRVLGGRILIAPDYPLPKGDVFAAGVACGDIEKGRLVPHHQLFSAYGRAFLRQIDLSPDDNRLDAYLHGDVIKAEGENGYAAVLVAACPLGGAKVVDGLAKNLYPKGLRRSY